MTPLTPEDVKKMFFEKAHESEFGFVLSFLILYLDIVAFVITGQNLLNFKFSDIEQNIPIGKMIVALLPFFLILPLLSKVRTRLRMWRRMQEFRDDTDSVSIGKIWLYAARKNEKVLYDLALSEWKRIGNRDRQATLIFSLCILAVVDMLWPGLLLNSLILQNFANYAGWNIAVCVAVVAVVFFLWNLGNTLTPPSWGDFHVPLPGHPLSEQQAEEREKARVEALAMEKRKAEIESQIRMKESKSPGRPGPTQRPPE